eukprot:CAMPEP_0194298164 /NCGR_PEP_ID=MMETSP0169-20130528/60010_1 /TAXON_ID=218684 /ORGANISM="Corethron pennatum, Strain L29A3" /LENGTH=831 /DNA_ID=CAMNT_0039048119 /DNA_START=231 /DNA_END=2731 /DNA_ORIENTATION=+
MKFNHQMFMLVFGFLEKIPETVYANKAYLKEKVHISGKEGQFERKISDFKIDADKKAKARLLQDIKWNLLGDDIDGEAAYDYSGWAVSMNGSGDRAIVGGYGNDGNGSRSGHARVYKWDNNAWVQMGPDLDGEAADDKFGWAVSMNGLGDKIIVGGRDNDGNGSNSGHARVYEWEDNKWVQMGPDLNGEAAGDYFGYSVSMSGSGDKVIVGGYANDGNGNNSGHARVYKWDTNNWVQMGPDLNGEAAEDNLVEDNKWVQMGPDLNGKAAEVNFGYSVSMSASGDKVIVGGLNIGVNSGYARVYKWDTNNWVQMGPDLDGEAASDLFGYSVSMSGSGDKVIVGGTGNDGNGSYSGHARIYEWEDNKWVQMGPDLDGEAAGDYFGFSVSMSGSGEKVIVGGVSNGGNGHSSGHARVYEWREKGTTTTSAPSDAPPFYRRSTSVSMSVSGDKVIVGGYSNDGNGSYSGHARVYEWGEKVPLTTSAPSTIFNRQSFTISNPKATFVDNSGEFFIELNYTIGSTANDLNITLMNENCTTIDKSVSSTVQIGYQNIQNQMHSKQILLSPENFRTSSLVSQRGEETGLSAGTVAFCVKAEALTEEDISVSFKKSNIKLTFDLTRNNFKVESNGIVENKIDTTEEEVTSTYGVIACRCTAGSYECDKTLPLPNLQQNGLVYACLKPDENSTSVEITNFNMIFKQNGDSKYIAVTMTDNGPATTPLSGITEEGSTFKVVSRLVTKLFEESSFNITGNAYLAFKPAKQRNLGVFRHSSLRLVQESVQDSSVGEDQFEMKVNLEKATVLKTEPTKNATIVISIMGTILMFSIAFTLFKKKVF